MAQLTDEAQDKLYADWEAKWRAQDFSWEGLAEKEWHAPVDFPGEGAVVGDGDMAYRVSNLQEYWRWSIGYLEGSEKGCLLTDDQLIELGMLVRINNRIWHILYLKDTVALPKKYTQSGNDILPFAITARMQETNKKQNKLVDNRIKLSGVRARWIDSIRPIAPQDLKPFYCLNFDFSYADLHGISFTDERFGKNTSFAFAYISSQTYFSDCEFKGHVSFNRAIFVDRVRFYNTCFLGEVYFRGVQVLEEAEFEKCDFRDSVYFQDVNFFSQSNFKDTIFHQDAIFKGAIFNSYMHWCGAEFHQYANFIDTVWGGENIIPDHYGKSFSRTKFRSTASFDTNKFNAFAAFDGAQFDKTLYLRLPSSSNEPKDRFQEACRAVEAQIEKDGGDAREASTQRWGELASGYKTVKAVMEREGDFDRAQIFHSFEIQARMHQPRIGRWESATSFIYGLTSDYGGSIGRPILTLVMIWVAAILTYILLSFLAGQAEFGPLDLTAPFSPTLMDAMSLSTKSALLNLDSFGGSAATIAATNERLFSTGFVAGCARLIGIAQTFSSLILAFLFGLAVRRKFQIR